MARVAAIAWDPDHLAMQLFRVGSLGGAREDCSVMTGRCAAKKHGEQL
jgi:hypothetical protein